MSLLNLSNEICQVYSKNMGNIMHVHKYTNHLMAILRPIHKAMQVRLSTNSANDKVKYIYQQRFAVEEIKLKILKITITEEFDLITLSILP